MREWYKCDKCNTRKVSKRGGIPYGWREENNLKLCTQCKTITRDHAAHYRQERSENGDRKRVGRVRIKCPCGWSWYFLFRAREKYSGVCPNCRRWRYDFVSDQRIEDFELAISPWSFDNAENKRRASDPTKKEELRKEDQILKAESDNNGSYCGRCGDLSFR